MTAGAHISHDGPSLVDTRAREEAAIGWLIDERVADEAARYGKRYDQLTADERRSLEDSIAPGVFGLISDPTDEQVAAWREIATRQTRGQA